MQKSLKELGKTLLVWLGLIVLAFLIAILTGHFWIDASGDSSWQQWAPYGVYNSALRNLPAYYNPLLDSIFNAQLDAIIFLPLFLLVFRKRLKLPVVPWLMAIIIFTASIPIRIHFTSDIDPLVTSEWVNVPPFEVFFLSSLIISYSVFGWLRIAAKKRQQRG